MPAIHGHYGLSMPLSVTRKCSIFAHFIGVFLVSDIPFFFIRFARSPASWRFSFSQSPLPKAVPSPSPHNHSAAGHVFTPSRSPYLPLQQFS